MGLISRFFGRSDAVASQAGSGGDFCPDEPMMALALPMASRTYDWGALDYKGQGSEPASEPARLISGKSIENAWTDQQLTAFVRESYRIAGVVFRCLTLIADSFAEAPLRAYQDEAGQDRELPTHEARALFAEPNPEQGEAEFWTSAVLIAGLNGFVYIEKVRARDGSVVQLYPRTPGSLKRRERRDGTIYYEQRVDGRIAKEIPAADIAAVPYMPDPSMRQIGISPVSVLGREIGIDVTLTAYLKSFLDDSGIPPFVITSKDPITDAALVEQARAQWGQRYGKGGAWGVPPILHGGWSVDKVGLDLNEMAFPDLRGITELRIASGMGVPPHVLGALEAVKNGGLATTEVVQAMKLLQLYTVNQLRKRFAANLTRQVLREFPDAKDRRYSLRFDVSQIESLQEDEDRKALRARADMTAGGITREEFRTVRGYKPELQDGETLLMPFSTIEVVVGESSPTPSPAPVLAPAKAERRYRDAKSLSRRDLEIRAAVVDHQRAAQKKYTEILNRQMKKYFKAQGQRLTSALMKGEGDPFVRRDLAVALKLADVYAAKATGDTFEPCAGDRHYSAVNDPRLALGRKDVAEIASFDWDAEEKSLAEILNKFYSSVGEAAFDSTGKLLGVDLNFDLANPNIQDTLDQLGTRVVGINETTRLDVARTVSDGLEAGRTVDEIAGDLNGMFEDTYKGRSLAIARTESMVSLNTASALGYEESGLVKEIECYDNPDHTDPYPGALDGLSCSERNSLVAPLADAQKHIESEHVNGSLAIGPVIATGGT